MPDSQVKLDSQNRLTDLGICPSIACLSIGTAQVAENGNDAIVSWGRWTNGTARTTLIGFTSQVALTQNQGLHYLVGAPVVSLPTQGTFSYSLLGATAPTLRDGSAAPGTFSGKAIVEFASGQNTRVGLYAQVNVGGVSYAFQTQGGTAQPGSSQLRVSADYSFTGDLSAMTGSTGCATANCAMNVRGALFGSQGERLGINYTIAPGSNSSKIDGVAVFKR